MTLSKLKSNKQSNDVLSYSHQIVVNPILVVTKKTLKFNVCTIKKLIISIFLMVLVPVIFLLFIPSNAFDENSTLTETLGVVLYFYSFGLIFPLLIGGSAAPLISDELKTGTMLTLVSKPISRTGIVLGKLIAVFIYGIILSVVSLLFIMLVSLGKYLFPDLGIFFFINFTYSLLIIICFGGLTLGISCVFKRPRNVLLIPLIIIIFSFLIGLIIKSFLVLPSFFDPSKSLYEQYQIYHFDFSYHMGNIYNSLASFYVPGSTTSWFYFLIIFGVTKSDPTLYCNESGSCGIVYGKFIETNYYLPGLSGLLLILIGVLLLIGGTLYLNKRDISG